MELSVSIMPVGYSTELHKSQTLLKKYSDTEYGLAEFTVPDDKEIDNFVLEMLESEMGIVVDKSASNQVHTFGAVDRVPDKRVVSVFYIINLGENLLEGLPENLAWFDTNSAPTRLVLSHESEDITIIAYRDGRSTGDATLVYDHTLMLTYTM